MTVRGDRARLMLAWEEASDIIKARRKRKLTSDTMAGAPLLGYQEIRSADAMFVQCYGYSQITAQETGPRTVSRIVHAMETGEVFEGHLLQIKTRTDESACPVAVPSNGDAAGVLPAEPKGGNITDIGALTDRLWTLFHGYMTASLKLNRPRLQPSWPAVMSHIAFITGAELARRNPPPDLKLVMDAELALRQEWNRKFRADDSVTLTMMLAEPRKNIDHWNSFVFIPQGQQTVEVVKQAQAAAQNSPPQWSLRPESKGKHGKGKGGGKNQGKQSGAKPTFWKTNEEKKLCFAYNSKKGCSEPCPKGFEHACQRCQKIGHSKLDAACPQKW